MTSKLKNLLLRLLNAIIWIPVLVSAAIFLTANRHLLARVLMLLFNFIAGIEIGNLLKRKEPTLRVWPFPFLTSVIPTLTVLFQEFPAHLPFYIFAAVFVLIVVFTWEVFTYSDARSSAVLVRLGSYLFAIIYPGLFFTFMIMLPMLDYPVTTFTMFFFITMLNDSFAYFVGLLLGKRTNTRGLVLVSPKKSLVGFAGGILASIVTTLVFFYWIQPEIFGQRGVWYAISIGFSCAILCIVGDLFESLLKRSADIKDSGKFFMGRGGVLDSVDSLIFVAPIYYYFMAFA